MHTFKLEIMPSLQQAYLVPTFPYCAASSGCEAEVTKPSPYFDASIAVLLGVAFIWGIGVAET